MQGSALLMTKEAAEKTARSIFVGNIPYEATEEKLIELFSKAGPVIGFRLVYDRESGKPKGYGFCEYNNAAIAASALRNLQNIEFNGRPLRIGPAAGEQNSAELALSNPAVGPPLESPYGDAVDPQAAPEAISRAVASLPPEQMYELMKQMKLCIQNNPNEARNMLLQNPQLAYALLQAQIVMKIVDPKVAIAMLNRTHDQIPPIMAEESGAEVSHRSAPPSSVNTQPVRPTAPSTFSQPPMHQPPIDQPSMHGPSPTSIRPNFYPGAPGMPPMPPGGGFPQSQQHFDFPPGGQPHPAMPPASMAMPQATQPGFPPMGAPPRAPMMRPPGGQVTPAMAAAVAANMGPNSLLAGQGEQEKINLIMQVLQLSDEQLALLPDDQRRSIMILKDQLGKTGAF